MSRRRPHRQVREVKGSGRKMRLHNHTRKGCGSIRVDRLVGKAVKAADAKGPKIISQTLFWLRKINHRWFQSVVIPSVRLTRRQLVSKILGCLVCAHYSVLLRPFSRRNRRHTALLQYQASSLSSIFFARVLHNFMQIHTTHRAQTLWHRAHKLQKRWLNHENNQLTSEKHKASDEDTITHSSESSLSKLEDDELRSWVFVMYSFNILWWTPLWTSNLYLDSDLYPINPTSSPINASWFFPTSRAICSSSHTSAFPFQRNIVSELKEIYTVLIFQIFHLLRELLSWLSQSLRPTLNAFSVFLVRHCVIRLCPSSRPQRRASFFDDCYLMSSLLSEDHDFFPLRDCNTSLTRTVYFLVEISISSINFYNNSVIYKFPQNVFDL